MRTSARPHRPEHYARNAFKYLMRWKISRRYFCSLMRSVIVRVRLKLFASEEKSFPRISIPIFLARFESCFDINLDFRYIERRFLFPFTFFLVAFPSVGGRQKRLEVSCWASKWRGLIARFCSRLASLTLQRDLFAHSLTREMCEKTSRWKDDEICRLRLNACSALNDNELSTKHSQVLCILLTQFSRPALSAKFAWGREFMNSSCCIVAICLTLCV